MKFGFSLSNNQGIADVQAIVRLAARAEALGFDSVWASDHIFNVSYVFERRGDGHPRLHQSPFARGPGRALYVGPIP